MAIKLVEVETTEPMPLISNVGHYSSVWVLVKTEGVPIGYAITDARGADISPERLATEISHSRCIDILRNRLYRSFIGHSERWESGSINPFFAPGCPDEPKEEAYLPFISVLVCTRDRPNTIKRTLDSLTALDYPQYEVLVIDNCPSTDETRKLVSQYPFRYVMESEPGLDNARNRGITESTGDIVAFIDDDAVADPKWLRGVASGFVEPDVMCLTGLTLPLELETRAQVIFETAYWGFSRGFHRKVYRPDCMWKYVPYWPSVFGTGCNMAFRREVFDIVGRFDPALDVGTPTGGGGDLDIFHSIVMAGGVIVYRPEALVFHKHRETESALRQQLYNNGKAYTAIFTKWFLNEPDSRWMMPRVVVKWTFQCYVRRLLRKLLLKEAMPLRFIVAEAMGSLCGPWAYLQARKKARGSSKMAPELEAPANVH